jgi:multidrug resistance protein MdtO
MSTATAGTIASGERQFFAFLRRELAPSPARWRATLRIVMTCAVATTLIMSFHIPDGEYLIATLFVVSQSDAWASLTKAWLRVVGTVLGGVLAILALIACSDKPWLLFPLQALVIAVALFLSRTTTAPYAFILGGATFFIVVPEFIAVPGANLAKGLWRIFLTAVGALLGTAAHVSLWPDDPEELLLQDLAARLALVEKILDRVAVGPATQPAKGDAQLPTNAMAVAGMARQLDLLNNAEAMSRWLRERHTEQIKLIASVELLVISALRLDHLDAQQAGLMEGPNGLRQRLTGIRDECARLRRALEERRPPEPSACIGADRFPEGATADARAMELLPSIHEMERALFQMPAAMAFLGVPTVASASLASSQPSREPVAERRLFTAACSLSNTEMIQFALKSALAAFICGLLIQAFDWPGLSTSLVTCMIVAQSSFGAGLSKALLRFSGAALGGLAALLVVVSVLPAMESLASLLVVTTALFMAAAWLISGSSRISYAGLQMAMAMSLVLINSPEPTTDLTLARDRLLGVLLGIVVMGGVDFALWPVFARLAVPRTLAAVLRRLAGMQRLVSHKQRAQVCDTAFAIYRDLTSVLSLQDAVPFEPVPRGPGVAVDRRVLLQWINAVQEVFLKLSAAGRHAVGMPLDGVSPPLLDQMHILDEAIAQYLEALADRLEGRQDHAVPAASKLLSDAAKALQAHARDATTDATMLAHLKDYGVLSRELLDALVQLEQDLQVAAEVGGGQDRGEPATATRLGRGNALSSPR